MRKTKVSGVNVSMTGERNVLVVGLGHHAKRVDLESDGGRGWCECEDFVYRVQPLRKKGFKDAACKHIKAAFDALGRLTSKEWSAQAGVGRTRSGEP